MQQSKIGAWRLCVAVSGLLCLALAAPMVRGDTSASAPTPGAAARSADNGLLGDTSAVPTIKLAPLDSDRLAADPGLSEQGQVGVEREPPEIATRHLDAGNPGWQALADGRSVLTVAVYSPGAIAMRIGLQVRSLPPEAMLSFAGEATAGGTAAVTSFHGSEIRRLVGANLAAEPDNPAASLFWSPVIDGPRATVQLVLPAGAATDAVDLAIAKVSHIFVVNDLSSTEVFAAAALGDASSCEIDVLCAIDNTIRDRNSRGVARMIFQKSGGTYVCSGTLLSDNNPSQSGFFLTANHCISTQLEASTIEFDWNFRASTCGGSQQDTAYTRVAGGATLLSTVGYDHDATLLRMNRSPPTGAWALGWTTEPAAVSATLHVVHHPRADWQKVTFGQRGNRKDCTFSPLDAIYFCEENGTGFFYNMSLTEGIIEPGSSGAGVFADDGLLRGLVSHSNATCGASLVAGFADFGSAYSAGGFATWLNPSQEQPAVEGVRNLSSRGLVTPTNSVNGGVVVDGEARVLITARGPSTGLKTALQDTTLTLYRIGTGQAPQYLAENDDWGTSTDEAEIARLTSARELGALEAAIVTNLSSGAYSAVAQDYEQNDTGEVVLGFTVVEDGTVTGEPKNLSSRGLIRPGNAMTGGIVVNDAVRVLITARGPSTGLASALPNTALKLYRIRTGETPQLVQQNDDWAAAANADEIRTLTANRVLDGPEAAILTELTPGAYTAVAEASGAVSTGEAVLGFTVAP